MMNISRTSAKPSYGNKNFKKVQNLKKPPKKEVEKILIRIFIYTKRNLYLQPKHSKKFGMIFDALSCSYKIKKGENFNKNYLLSMTMKAKFKEGSVKNTHIKEGFIYEVDGVKIHNYYLDARKLYDLSNCFVNNKEEFFLKRIEEVRQAKKILLGGAEYGITNSMKIAIEQIKYVREVA